jgi:hypothetical protein
MADRTSVAITVIVIGCVLFVGANVVGMDVPSQEEVDAEREAFAEYCHTEFGDEAEVYRANDAYAAEHNGLHCDHDAGTVHKNQIPGEIWEAYMAGEVSVDYVTSQLEEPPGILPIPDAGMMSWVSVGLLVLLSVVILWAISGGMPRMR